MKFYLEPKGWPVEIKNAPNGLVMRLRKGKPFLYFKSDGKHLAVPPLELVLDMDGNQTVVTGTVTPVVLKVEK